MKMNSTQQHLTFHQVDTLKYRAKHYTAPPQIKKGQFFDQGVISSSDKVTDASSLVLAFAHVDVEELIPEFKIKGDPKQDKFSN